MIKNSSWAVLLYSLGLSMHFILSAGLGIYFRYMTKEDIGIEAQYRAKILLWLLRPSL